MPLHGLEQARAQILALRLERIKGKALGLKDVEVQVAVADMAEPAHLERRVTCANDLVDLLQERRHGRHAHCEVVLVGREAGDALRDVVAHCPQRLGLGLGLAHHAVGGPAAFQRSLKGTQRLGLLHCIELDERVERRRRGEGALPPTMGEHLLERNLGEKLKGR